MAGAAGGQLCLLSDIQSQDVPVRHIHDGHNLLRRQIYRKAEQRAQGLSQPTQGRTFKGRQKGSQSRCTEKKAKDGSPHTGCQFCCACSSQVFLSCAGGNGVGRQVRSGCADTAGDLLLYIPDSGIHNRSLQKQDRSGSEHTEVRTFRLLFPADGAGAYQPV